MNPEENEEEKSTRDKARETAQKAKDNYDRAKKAGKIAQKGAKKVASRIGKEGAKTAGKAAAQGGTELAASAAGEAAVGATAAAGASTAAAGAAAAGTAATGAAAATGVAAAGAATGAAAAGAGAAGGVAVATSEVWVPALLIALVILLFIGFLGGMISVLFGSNQTLAGNLQCTSIGGSCQPGPSCPSGSTQDTTGATCTTSTDICCMPSQTFDCTAAGGSCQSTACSGGTTITNSNCSAASPICCLPPNTLPPIHFYCQYDPKYSKPNTICSIIQNGCDPTSIAMIVSSYGSVYNPYQVSMANGQMGCNSATNFTQTENAVNNWVSSLGFAIQSNLVAYGSMTTPTTLIAKLTSQGFYILAGGCMTFNSTAEPSGGHSIVIAGVNPDGTLKVYDPTYCTTDQNYTVRNFNTLTDLKTNLQTNGRCGFNGWGFMYAIKKP